MMRIPGLVFCLVSIAGCTTGQTDAVYTSTTASSVKAQTYVFECADGFSFVARTEADTAWVFLPGNTVDLPRLETAAGESYAKGGFMFQITADTATVVTSEGKFTDCRNNRAKAIWEHAKLNGVDFRALGNEPGWNLEISGPGLLLVTDYGQHSYRFNSSDISSDTDSKTTIYKARNNGDSIKVVISGTACRDSMSGERFPAKVSVVVNGKRYTGCGKALH